MVAFSRATAALALACVSTHVYASTRVRAGPPCYLYSTNIESPCFYELSNSSAYSLRVYGHDNLEFWTSAQVTAGSFSSAAQMGFQLNFAYIEGSNDQGVKIPMTAPVAIRTKDQQYWNVSFYVPASLYQNLSSIPVPKSPQVKIVGVGVGVFAVSMFQGFASWADFQNVEAQLRAALAADGITVVQDAWEALYNQYDSPFVIFNRHNEVWLHVDL